MRKILLLTIHLLCYFSIKAQPGSLDPTFGNNGNVRTYFIPGNYRNESGQKILFDEAGKMYVLINEDNGTVITRYNTDGSLDLSYGDNGYHYLNLNNYSGIVDAKFQDDGKVIILYKTLECKPGQCYTVPSFARITYDGTTDLTFGIEGISTLSGNSGYFISSLAIQSDRRIIAAGYHENQGSWNFATVRLTANGNLDNSFDADGVAVTDLGPYNEQANSVAIQTDGKILVAGTTGTDFGLVRYNIDGTLDNSFSEDGKVITDFGHNENKAYIGLQNDGKVILAGTSFYTINGIYYYDVVLSCYGTDGTLDNSFSEDGKVVTDLGNKEFATSLSIQQNGKIVIGGYSEMSTDNIYNSDVIVLRYNTDGALDNSFDGDGSTSISLLSNDYLNYLTIQSDGKIIATGRSFDPELCDNEGCTTPSNDYSIIRINDDGSLDTSFDDDGKLLSFFPYWQSFFTSLLVGNNGEIMAAGGSKNGGSAYVLSVAKYNTDGSLDNTFADYGKLIVNDVYIDNITNTPIALQSDGKFIVGNSSFGRSSAFSYDFVLRRYNADGSIDNSFGINGEVVTDFGMNERIQTLIVQNDDKFIAAGVSNFYGEEISSIVIARYNADGTLDHTFSEDGKQTVQYEETEWSNSQVMASAYLPDGKFILAVNTESLGFVLSRFNSDGTLDNTFNEDGTVKVESYLAYERSPLAIQEDGKLLVGYNLSIKRYNTDGSFDNTFDADGTLLINFDNQFDKVTDIKVQDNGKIIIAGVNNTQGSAAIARFNTDGTIDNSFGNNGIYLNKMGTSSDYNGIYAMAIYQDRLYAVGEYWNRINQDASVSAHLLECVKTAYYEDADGDGFGNNSIIPVQSCSAISGYVSNNTDCNDGVSAVHPGAAEVCNGIDDNCDGQIDEGVRPTGTITGTQTICDGDQAEFTFNLTGTPPFNIVATDQFGSSIAVNGIPGYTFTRSWSLNNISSSRTFKLTSVSDANCSAQAQDMTGAAVVTINPKSIWYFDADSDGYGNPAIEIEACSAPTGYVINNTDCNDNDAAVHPGATELCNGEDDNCNGQIDEGLTQYTYYIDSDGDGYGIASSIFSCSSTAPQGHASSAGDCDDNNLAIHPGATEVCNGLDDDCDGQIDEEVKTTFYVDADGDSYGNSSVSIQACSPPAGYVANSTDCNDGNAVINPGSTEICGNGTDDNCDGQIDEGCPAKTTLSINDIVVYESAGVAILTVTLSKKTAVPVSFSYSTADGTARSKATKNSPKDYNAASGTGTIPAGAQTASFSITIINDVIAEGDENFTVRLAKPVNASINDGTAIVTIKNGSPSFITSSKVKVNGQVVMPTDNFRVNAYPNPSNKLFVLNIWGNKNERINIKVIDIMGRVIETRSNIAVNTSISFGDNYHSGQYFVEVQQGKERKQLKLIKLSE